MPSLTDRLTVPPNTTERSPVIKTLYVGSRFIQSIAIVFPSGCRGLVYVKAVSTYMDLTEWVRGENQVINVNVNRMIEEPCHITVKAYNVSVDWEHTIEIKVDYLRERAYVR